MHGNSMTFHFEREAVKKKEKLPLSPWFRVGTHGTPVNPGVYQWRIHNVDGGVPADEGYGQLFNGCITMENGASWALSIIDEWRGVLR
jgi:hypothetical protein